MNKCHLDLRDGVARLQVDKKAIQLDVSFTLRDGSSPPPGLFPPDYTTETLAANAPVEGQLILRQGAGPTPLRGVGAVLHSWTAIAEEAQIERRLDFFTLTPGVGIQLSEVQTPDGGVHRWLRTTGPITHPLTLAAPHWERRGHIADAPQSYPIEAELLLDTGEVRGTIALAQILHQQDPLEAIPEPLRTLLGWTLTMEPHQAWVKVPYDLTVEGTGNSKPQHLSGAGIAAIAYTRKP